METTWLNQSEITDKKNDSQKRKGAQERTETQHDEKSINKQVNEKDKAKKKEHKKVLST